MSEPSQTTPEYPQIKKRFLLTWGGLYVYFPSETWSLVWRGIRWSWLPELSKGMGLDGWTFHWMFFIAERFCFDDDDWGQQTQEDIDWIIRMSADQTNDSVN